MLHAYFVKVTTHACREMRFISTRGGISGASFEEALLSGYASDGGMFLPESIPRLSREEMSSWASFTYPQIVENVLKLYISPEEMTRDELHSKLYQ